MPTDKPAVSQAQHPIYCPGCDEPGASHVVGTIEHPAEPARVAANEAAAAKLEALTRAKAAQVGEPTCTCPNWDPDEDYMHATGCPLDPPVSAQSPETASESSLRRALDELEQQRGQYKANWLNAVDHGLAQHIIKVRELTKEREARKQAEVEHFNAGWNGALKAVGQDASKLCGWDLSSINRRLYKPVPATSQTPSQPTGGGE